MENSLCLVDFYRQQSISTGYIILVILNLFLVFTILDLLFLLFFMS